MDIDYLLFLQDFRNGTQDFLTPLMEFLSDFAVNYLFLLPVFIYWVVNKRNGLYILASYYLCTGVNAAVKLTACVYRPWIRDARVLPAGDSISSATGYSFPSGHTVAAGPFYGGLAVTAWSKAKVVSVLCGIMVLLTGFSRNYLGVHTPQDVAVAIFESVFWLIVMYVIFRYLDTHPEKENLFLLLCLLLGVGLLVFITFKPYPMDYVDGSLLVDPQKMMNDGYGDIALIVAFPIARFIERKWIRLEPMGLNAKGVIIGLVGLVPAWAIKVLLKAPLVALLGGHWGKFARSALLVLYCIALFPALIKLIQRKRSITTRRKEKLAGI